MLSISHSSCAVLPSTCSQLSCCHCFTRRKLRSCGFILDLDCLLPSEHFIKACSGLFVCLSLGVFPQPNTPAILKLSFPLAPVTPDFPHLPGCSSSAFFGDLLHLRIIQVSQGPVSGLILLPLNLPRYYHQFPWYWLPFHATDHKTNSSNPAFPLSSRHVSPSGLLSYLKFNTPLVEFRIPPLPTPIFPQLKF